MDRPSLEVSLCSGALLRHRAARLKCSWEWPEMVFLPKKTDPAPKLQCPVEPSETVFLHLKGMLPRAANIPAILETNNVFDRNT